MTGTKSRSSSTASRNDLFSVSWTSEAPPPKPLRGQRNGNLARRASLRGAEAFGHSPEPSDLPTPPTGQSSPRTLSFFDDSASGPINPPPAPRLSSSPRPHALSRSASLRARLPPPLRLESPYFQSIEEPLSPLHQSPSLPSSSSSIHLPWQPPLPPSSEDVNLRFEPSSTYLLGEGRYAKVYLAAYKREREVEGRRMQGRGSRDGAEVNARGNDIVGGSWRLCAAKSMSPDRDSQTMGLREAFFLGRLIGPGPMKISRALSPLRDGTDKQMRRHGADYIVKLIAVKEEREVGRRGSAHGRLASEFKTDKSLLRQRSSTCVSESLSSLASSPSLPALAQAAKAGPPTTSLSRWVLLLEHAPLGTVDRMLRTSPHLVGRQLWERWAMEGAEALEWVHGKGIVHADIKPANLLLTSDLHIRLSDFGSSLLIHPSHPPIDGLGLGTLPFSPPELVDPSQFFSFPVDVFALGATLYQCITGREPFRGVRSVEMMHHVRKGALWAWEERERLSRIGNEEDVSLAGSPYPSAWRDFQIEGVKRTGSLRIPQRDPRPRLARMSSAESLRASEDAADGPSSAESPAGVKLWAKWIKNRQATPTPDAVSLLLSEVDDPKSMTAAGDYSFTPSAAHSRQSPLSSPISPVRPVEKRHNAGTAMTYADGSPVMMFLDGMEYVPDDVREVFRAMVDPLAEDRPTAEEVRRLWGNFSVGDEPAEGGL